MNFTTVRVCTQGIQFRIAEWYFWWDLKARGGLTCRFVCSLTSSLVFQWLCKCILELEGWLFYDVWNIETEVFKSEGASGHFAISCTFPMFWYCCWNIVGVSWPDYCLQWRILLAQCVPWSTLCAFICCVVLQTLYRAIVCSSKYKYLFAGSCT